MAAALISAPTESPLTLQQVKSYLRVTHSTEDDLINLIIKSVIDRCEKYSGLQLCTATWQHSMESFREVVLPKPPHNELMKIEYLDISGQKQTLNSSSYRVNSSDNVMSISFNKGLPSLDPSAKQAVFVTYESGYKTIDMIPSELILAMLYDAGFMYEHRVEAITGTIVSELPRSARQIYEEYSLI